MKKTWSIVAIIGVLFLIPLNLVLADERDIEIRPQYDYNPSNKFRGTVENDGYVRARDYNGNTLRGYVDQDGYGTLRDQNGNSHRIRPR